MVESASAEHDENIVRFEPDDEFKAQCSGISFTLVLDLKSKRANMWNAVSCVTTLSTDSM